MSQLLIASFVIRLFRVTEPEADGEWRVSVRHVQTGEEVRFTRLADALSYIEQAAADETVPAAEPQ